MLTPRQPILGSQGPVHARFSKRRERRPGLRERHAFQQPDKILEETEAPETPRSAFVSHVHVGGWTERCTIRPESIRTPRQAKLTKEHDNNEVQISTHYKELSTIEAIRKHMVTQPRPQAAPPTLPDWLLNLDMNLDVTPIDIIPPFESSKPDMDGTFSSRPKVTIIHEEHYHSDSDTHGNGEDMEQFTHQDVTERTAVDSGGMDGRQLSSRLSNYSKREDTTKGPRRYQGDMKVMSMQTGGIRSTPFQPKAKKFINQMITYHHMKFHNKKLKTVKPAVDAKMPSTFHIALDRKKLVEERLSKSWDGSYHSSTPRRTTTPSSLSKSSHKDRDENS